MMHDACVPGVKACLSVNIIAGWAGEPGSVDWDFLHGVRGAKPPGAGASWVVLCFLFDVLE